MKGFNPITRSTKLLLLATLLLVLAPSSVRAQRLLPPAVRQGEAPASPATAYSFTEVARLGDPAPGGGHFINDLEAWGFNNHGMVSFAADLDSGGEGAFLGQKGEIKAILRTGDAAPGGGTVGFGILGHQALNEQGDLVAAWLREPFELPFGKNAAVYRYSHQTGTSSALMLPGMPAPGGATFQGAFFHAAVNNQGEAVFPGLISPTSGINGNSLGLGIFQANQFGTLSRVALPGDTVPEGVLDSTLNPWINDAGDVAFSGHVAGEECIPVWDSLGAGDIACGESIYLKRAATGKIVSIAHQGAPIPPSAGGGTYHYAWGPVLNNRGEVVFIGDLSAPLDICQVNGVFLWKKGKVIKVARPGDPMPGGGHMVTATCSVLDYFFNDKGDVSFDITLDTQTNGVPDTGLYISSRGSVRLVARTGTVIHGVGTIATVKPPFGYGGAMMNERGQVLFQAGLTDGAQVLLIASPVLEP